MNWLRPPAAVAPNLRIGLLGGSFNPAHEGHVYVSEVARKRLGLDYVWWLVSPQNPLKPQNGMAPFAERMAGARKIVGNNPHLKVTDVEARLFTRYTFDTLKALSARFKVVRFVWLMGSDNLEQFHRWQHWEDIVKLVPIAVVERPGTILAPLKAKAMQRFAHARAQGLRPPPAFVIVDGRRNWTSASAIRANNTASF